MTIGKPGVCLLSLEKELGAKNKKSMYALSMFRVMKTLFWYTTYTVSSNFKENFETIEK